MILETVFQGYPVEVEYDIIGDHIAILGEWVGSQFETELSWEEIEFFKEKIRKIHA